MAMQLAPGLARQAVGRGPNRRGKGKDLSLALRRPLLLACSEMSLTSPGAGETTESVTKLVMAATESAAEQQATIFPD